MDIKFLYFSVVKVCRNWHTTICGLQSEFLVGYFRNTLKKDPYQTLSLYELKLFTLPLIKHELEERDLSVKGKKEILIKRLHGSIKVDELPQNITNRDSVRNRNRLLVFQMKKMFRNELFCQNCHRDFTQRYKERRDWRCWGIGNYVRRLTNIHCGIRVCTDCQRLEQYQNIRKDAVHSKYGLSMKDIARCGVQWRADLTHPGNKAHYINVYVATEIAKMKYGPNFKKSYRNVPDIDFEVDRIRFEQDEILYNATLRRRGFECLKERYRYRDRCPQHYSTV